MDVFLIKDGTVENVVVIVNDVDVAVNVLFGHLLAFAASKASSAPEVFRSFATRSVG